MQTIRRWYLYVVTFVSLEVVLWGTMVWCTHFLYPDGNGYGVEQSRKHIWYASTPRANLRSNFLQPGCRICERPGKN
jgi:hypothetical protein